MSEEIQAPRRPSRRTAVRAGAVTAATAVAALAASSRADAAAGQAVVQGVVNTVGTASTTLVSSGAGISLTVKNVGTGAAAFFFSQNNNGFAGGTAGPSKYGLSAANKGAAGSGGALAATGIHNTGALANTTNQDRWAVIGDNLGTIPGSGGGILADGHVNIALQAQTSDTSTPAIVSFGDTYAIDAQRFTVDTVANAVFYSSLPVMNANATYDARFTLDGTGAGSVQLDTTGVDFTTATAVVTPNSGAMPDLFASVTTGGLLTISGGAAAGIVSYHVSAVPTAFPAPVTAGARTARATPRSLARAKAAVSTMRSQR